MPKLIMSEPCPVGNQLVTSCPARIATKTQSHVPPAPSPQPRSPPSPAARLLSAVSPGDPVSDTHHFPSPCPPLPFCSVICHIKLNLTLLARPLPAFSLQGARSCLEILKRSNRLVSWQLESLIKGQPVSWLHVANDVELEARVRVARTVWERMLRAHYPAPHRSPACARSLGRLGAGGRHRIIILNIFRLINYITKAKQLFLRCKWLQQLWLCFSYCRKKG